MVAVGDVRRSSPAGFDLLAAHRLEQPARDSDQRRVLEAPVANALAGPRRRDLGHATPALSASFLTVCTSQYWFVPSEPSITCAPVDHLAMVFDISSERNEPPNPITAENRSQLV